MIFRKLRGVSLPYREQGMIWFTCVNYDRQRPEIKEKIKRLCRECGGEHAEALFVLLTRENASVRWIEENYYVSESSLYRKRVIFFERWNQQGDSDGVPGMRGGLPPEGARTDHMLQELRGQEQREGAEGKATGSGENMPGMREGVYRK